MMMNRLVYIANARLPTEKAHGYQICKMCEAFAQNSMAVLLLHPYRHQHNLLLQRQSVFDYYGLARTFATQTLPNFDVVRLGPLFPEGIFAPLFFVHAVLWGLYAALMARREKADLYYTRDSAVAYWLLRLELPTVYEAHVVPKRAQRKLLPWIAQRPTLQLVVTLTSFIKERFVEIGFPAERVVVLPDGVDLSLFADLPSREECRRRLGLPQDRLIMGYVGRFHTLEMEKGIPELIQAIAYLPSLGGKEPLLLCVGGPMDAVPAYLALARRYGVPESRLRFIDRVPNREVPFWIRAFDISAAPFPNSEHYAYFMSPLKLFEYMMAGVPIIASDLPSVREVLRHGNNAWLVEPGSSSSLRQGIELLVVNSSLGAKLAEQAKADVRNYAWVDRASRILQRLGGIRNAS